MMNRQFDPEQFVLMAGDAIIAADNDVGGRKSVRFANGLLNWK